MEKIKSFKKHIIISIVLIILLVIGISINNSNKKHTAENNILNQLKSSSSFEGFEVAFNDNTYILTAPEGSIEEEYLQNQMKIVWMLKALKNSFGKNYNYEETDWYQTEKVIGKTSKNVFDELGKGYTIELWRLSEENDEDNLLIKATDGEVIYNYVFKDISE